MASRPRPRRHAAAADPRARVGLSASGATVGAARRQEGRRAGRLSREEIELCRRHDLVRDPAAERVSALLPLLRRLVGELSIRDRLPQIELAMGDVRRATARRRAPACALVLRILAPLCRSDEALLAAFADAHDVEFWLQSSGPESAVLFRAGASRLAYTLPEFDLEFPYAPTEFTQVNPSINRVLVRRAMTLLDPRPGERIADFFCGLGNFTLPIARRGATAIGIEGSAALVRRAEAIAAHNGLAARATFASREPVRRHAGKPRGAGPARQGVARPAARRRDRAGQGAARRRRARRASSMSRARRRLSPATLACWCTSTAIRSPRPA